MNDEQLKQLWKAQPVTESPISLDDLRAKARRFKRRISWRNAYEYLTCVIVFYAFGRYIVNFPFPLIRAGSVLVMVGSLFLAWQLHRRASSKPLPSDAGERSWLEFRRAQLVRQRDALRSVAWWYVGPLVPGVVVFRCGVEFELDASAPFERGWKANALIAGVLLLVIAWNWFAAWRLQRKIDALDREAH